MMLSKSSFGLFTRSVLLTLVFLSIVFLATGGSALADGSAQNAGATGNELQQAPVNPEFIEYYQEKAAGLDTVSLQVTKDGHKLGLIPSPISRPKVKDIPISVSNTGGSEYTSAGTSTVMYPASYDLRTVSKVSPVKNQGQFGTCWAYATYGSLESTLMPVTPAPDFSEKNLANLAGFDLDILDGGGNMWMSAAALTRWNGPVAESSDTYPQGSTWTISPTFSSAKHVQNVIFFPGRTSATDTGNIKSALTTYGAVYSAFWWNSAFYNTTSKVYYLPYSTAADTTGYGIGGHAVTIVGWNDNYPKANFKTASAAAPSGNGAWLVKNSWGTGWGNAGYFWISYYDKYFGSRYHADSEAATSTKDTAVFRGEPTTNYKTIYSYDKLGEVSDYSYGVSKTGSFANVFTTTSAGNITAVGFYTTDMNVPVTIKIYKNPAVSSPVTGTLVSTYGPLNLANMGYNTVKLPVAKQAKLTKGQIFSVVITVTNPTNDYYIPVEENTDTLDHPYIYTHGIVSTAGQGYAKSGTIWTDWSALVPDSHICIKAYAK